MRLHRLEAAAFGPFPDSIGVDFDDLSDAGLFLLTGPTGSGKTSVLDAVCFALYGDVPGDRASARQLRSDHAPAASVPRVQLDCTIAGRRWRIVRSPAWQRPKKRGQGSTGEQARVSLSEWRSGSWEPVSSRMDEVGHLITDLLGMTLSQFTQVALLPQGEFQAFLRSGADSRQKLLERLFRTGRFRDVEAWLADRRRALGRSSHEYAHQLSVLLSRVAEVTDHELPPDWDDTGLAAAADDSSVERWLTDRVDTARVTARHRAREREAAEKADRTSGDSLRAGQVLSEQQRRRSRAADEDARLSDLTDRHVERRTRLDAAISAAPVLALLTAEDAAREEVAQHADALQTACAAARAALADLPVIGFSADPGEPDFETGQQRAAQFATQLRAASPWEAQRRDLELQQQHDRDHVALLDAELPGLIEQSRRLPQRLADAQGRLRAAVEAHAQLNGLSEATASAMSRLTAAERAAALRDKLTLAERERQAAVGRVQQLTQAWLDIREHRLSGMAAEIATRLAVGGECPVCGSCEHPSPALGHADSPDAEKEQSARRRVDDAEVIRESVADRERGLLQAIAVAQETAGDNHVDDLARILHGAQEAQAAAREVSSTLEATQGEVDRLDNDLRSLEERRADHRRSIDTVDAALGERSRHLRQLDCDIAAARDGMEGDLRALVDRADTAADACAQATAHQVAHQRSTRVRNEAVERTIAAARQAGFADAPAARAAVLPESRRRELAASVRAHDDRVAAVHAVLSDPELLTASTLPTPDLGELEQSAEDSRARLVAATHADQTAVRRLKRTTELAVRVRELVDEWRPMREHHDHVSHLAAFAEGKAVDNRHQMRLSAFVLAYRLRQVVDAANERLAGMSDERYLLEHGIARSGRERRGGLGLLVRDAWSGTTRDPATLSGGETFIVSLALALGLADVVAQESGGAQLGILFVDEGFGSLDSETLEDVMETLDGLRSGGRVVGLVSHVAEMSDRIPAKVVLCKSPSGSTLRQVNA